MMKCIKCHEEIEENVQFCPYCGRAVDSTWLFTSQLLVGTEDKKSAKKDSKILNIFKKK